MDITEFNLFGDKVLVKGIDITERDGIIKPASYEDKPEIGEVISSGPGRTLENGTVVPSQVQKGDVVLFNKYSSTKFNLDGKDYFIVREDDIMGAK